MALIGRLFAIFFGFLAACFVAGAVIVYALLFPEMDMQTLEVDSGVLNLVLGFGFVLLSGFALVACTDRGVDHRSIFDPAHSRLRNCRWHRGLTLLSRIYSIRHRHHDF